MRRSPTRLLRQVCQVKWAAWTIKCFASLSFFYLINLFFAYSYSFYISTIQTAVVMPVKKMVQVRVIPDESQVLQEEDADGNILSEEFQHRHQAYGDHDFDDDDFDDDEDDFDSPSHPSSSAAASSLLEKILALKYLLPFSFRSRCSQFYHTCLFRTRQFSLFLGRGIWVLTTSLFLIGFPIFYEYQKEQQLILMDKEQRLFPSPASHAASLSPPPAL
jgi:mitochondrial import receptor subunit TOM22